MKKKKPKKKPNNGPRFVTEYVNRKGKRMKASDYGYRAWPFRGK